MGGCASWRAALLGAACSSSCGPPRADAIVLRTDRLYDAGRLERGLRRGRSPESAVLWRLDRPETLAIADEELTRRLSYQPLGKYWAFPLARALAERLRPTFVRPNAVTLASAGLMLSAASMVTAGLGLVGRSAVASVAGGGPGARHGGRAAGAAARDELGLRPLARPGAGRAGRHGAARGDRLGGVLPRRPAGWLLLGMLYASSKYLFQVQSLLGEELEGEMQGRGSAHPGRLGRCAARRGSGLGADHRTRAVDRPCRRAVASLDRARARGRLDLLSWLTPFYFASGRSPVRQEGGAVCLSPASRS